LLLLSSAQRVAELRDGTRSLRRAVWSGERLDAVLFLSTGSLPGIDWLIDCFADPSGRNVLAGCAAGARVETGAQVCACFNVGARTIAAVVRAGRPASARSGRRPVPGRTAGVASRRWNACSSRTSPTRDRSANRCHTDGAAARTVL
jgi:hypothetical protein